MLTAGIRIVTVAGIDFYQRRLSPHKGFCCAHRALHGRRSCSQFIRAAVERCSLWQALRLARRRFVACAEAARQLHTQPSTPPAEQESAKSLFCGGVADGLVDGCAESACCNPARACSCAGGLFSDAAD